MPYVYILRCADGAFYVGMTNDPVARFSQHLDGLASGFTSSRLPVEMVYVEEAPSLRAAVAREHQLKRWTRAKKEALIGGNLSKLHALSIRRKF
jgi:predicted GIY-YIG superfamily endonuclease